VTGSTPIFSVIIPTYRRPAPLVRCLEAMARSVLDRAGYEVIVVDDDGSAALEEAVAPLRGRMAVRLLRQENAGPAAARNTGAAVARGRFLAFTDDDCIPAPDWLDALTGPLRADPRSLVGGRVRNPLQANPYSSASQAILDLVYAHYNADPLRARFFASNNMALPAESFRALGGFTPSFRTSEDRDLCDRWLGAGFPMVYAPDAVVDHVRALTMGAFWRQHLGYGRGAYRFNRAHAQRSASDSTLESSFYIATLRRLPGVLKGLPPGRAAALVGLLGLWQAANLTGFTSEAVGSGLRVLHGRGRMSRASR
jgi:GT2 family glycosyltransferase